MVAKKPAQPGQASAVRFNHAMVYSRDVAAALAFYRDRLGFQVIETMETTGELVYARLRGPEGSGTMALHRFVPGRTWPKVDAIRLYFEVRGLDSFCRRLRRQGVRFTQLPKRMPWGWRHAYLEDPDGHEVSLYWAGSRRFRSSPMPPRRIPR